MQTTKSDNRKLNIAVVGAGLIGRRHIERIQSSTSCTLAAVVDPSSNAKEIAIQADAAYFESLESLLTNSLPDGIILATPNQLHVEQALVCLSANITTLIEKPVAATMQDGLALVAAEEASNGSILVGHHRAHSPIMKEAQSTIKSGVLGDLVAVTGSAMFYKPDSYFKAATWRTQVGGGPILINMIHEVHNLRMLCGEIDAVHAFSSNKTRGFQVEDTVAINLRFKAGVLGTFLLSDTAATAKSWEQTSQEDKSFAVYPNEDCYLLAGTKGSLEMPSMRLKTYASEASWWKPFDLSTLRLHRSDPLVSQLEHFCQVIRAETKPLVSLYDGLQNLKVVEAIASSASRGEVVILN